MLAKRNDKCSPMVAGRFVHHHPFTYRQTVGGRAKYLYISCFPDFQGVLRGQLSLLTLFIGYENSKRSSMTLKYAIS